MEAYANLLDRVILVEEEKALNIPQDDKLHQPLTSRLCSLKVSKLEAEASSETAHVTSSVVEASIIIQQSLINKFTPGFVVNVLPRTWIGFSAKVLNFNFILSITFFLNALYRD